VEEIGPQTKAIMVDIKEDYDYYNDNAFSACREAKWV
jgi:hypothetical protein